MRASRVDASGTFHDSFDPRMIGVSLLPPSMSSLRAAPSTSAGRGEPTLQPSYFTSSPYVSAVRDDITTLIHGFHEQYSKQPNLASDPFASFKAVWCSQGWTWTQFLVFDNQSRFSFLTNTLRLFLGKPFRRITSDRMLNLFSRAYSQNGSPLYQGCRATRSLYAILHPAFCRCSSPTLYISYSDSNR